MFFGCCDRMVKITWCYVCIKMGHPSIKPLTAMAATGGMAITWQWMRRLCSTLSSPLSSTATISTAHDVFPMKTETDDLCGDTSRDNIIDRTALDILEKLPKSFEIWRVKETLQMKLCPTGVVLLQELQRYNELVERIRKTLKLLRKVCEVSKFVFMSMHRRLYVCVCNVQLMMMITTMTMVMMIIWTQNKLETTTRRKR